jgi:hypothetical protein
MNPDSILRRSRPPYAARAFMFLDLPLYPIGTSTAPMSGNVQVVAQPDRTGDPQHRARCNALVLSAREYRNPLPEGGVRQSSRDAARDLLSDGTAEPNGTVCVECGTELACVGVRANEAEELHRLLACPGCGDVSITDG